MDTIAAAQTAGVTAATIRVWCRRNVIAAVKRAGRWVIDAASLAHRITIGRKDTPMEIAPLTRSEYEEAMTQLGYPRATKKDVRCHAEYQHLIETSKNELGTHIDSIDQLDALSLLTIRRGAALAAENYTPPAAKRGPGYAPGLPGQVFGGPSADRKNECHYCGLPLGPSGECDDCR